MRESGQTYLETIYLLHREKKRVRSVDVARALSYSKPSVYQAVCKLKDEGYLEEEGLDLVLTKEGKRLAQAIVERKETIIRFLMMAVNVDHETAEADAKRMTYFLSEKTYHGMKQFISE